MIRICLRAQGQSYIETEQEVLVVRLGAVPSLDRAEESVDACRPARSDWRNDFQISVYFPCANVVLVVKI